MEKNKKEKQERKMTNLLKLFLFSLLLLYMPLSRLNAACNATSVTICAAVDDTAIIYLNGTLIDTFTYCDIGWSCQPKCISLSPAQRALLNDSGNVLATYVQNTNCCELWGSWSMDITCADSSRVLSSSDSTNIKMLNDQTCMTAPTPNPSPTPQGGYQWYQPLYALDGNWTNPIEMTGKKWGKRIYDPVTGNLLHTLSYAATMSTSCGAIWFREPFSLTPVSTPAPPAFTITKSGNPTTGIQGNQGITFTLHICNTGGGTRGNVLTISDIWHTTVGNGWRFNYFVYKGANVGWSYTDDNFGSISADVNGPPTNITFNDGFLGVTCTGCPTICDDLVYSLYADNPVANCLTWDNDANLIYLGSPTIVSTVVLNNFCPSPTATPTVTMTIAAPAFSLLKTASKTTGIVSSDNISFNLHICNTGGYVTNPLTIFDDWSSTPDAWNFTGPYNNPDPKQSGNITQGGSGKTYTFTFPHGFPGGGYCYDLGFTVVMYSGSTTQCLTWYNKAYLTYLASPTLVSTVVMSNYCPSSTSTPTPLPPTSTITVTCTKTPTASNTPIFSPTLTVTQLTGVTITKSVNTSTAVFGDTITYCIAASNGTASLVSGFKIWDTIPACLTYVGCDNACTQAGSLISWSVNLPANSVVTVCFWGKITSYPFLNRHREFLALLDQRNYLYGTGRFKDWKDQENMHVPWISRESGLSEGQGEGL